MGNNGNLGAVYAGRFIAGLGVGQTTVVGPVYLAEIAPASIRGLCTCIFAGFGYLGIVLAYFANYGAQLNLGNTSAAQWVRVCFFLYREQREEKGTAANPFS
jgi:MFS family permease